MNNDGKRIKVESFIKKLKSAAFGYLAKGKYEKAAAIVSYCGEILYKYNQYYTDDDLENMINTISLFLSEKTKSEIEKFSAKKKVVVFYDGFGLYTRGVAINYLNALKKGGYKIVYVLNARNSEMVEYLKQCDLEKELITEIVPQKFGYIKTALNVLNIILKYSPEAMFFYTTPRDVSGAAAFGALKGKTKRFLIDLTDHAFWLGKTSVDYVLGSREMSAYIEHYGRHIPKENLIKLGVNLIIPKSDDHSGLPFDVKNNKYIFSGGSLYKTLGDKDKTYYKIVDAILSKHNEVLFLYAGSGDETEMNNLKSLYPGRFFLVPERKDFYYLIENCVFYLNTYPMFGGMMMKYAASAKKIPLTLKHNSDSDGLLINQKDADIEYDTPEDMIADADRLLSDATYLKQREELLEGTTISEARFVNNLDSAIKECKTDYNHKFETFDTEKFRQEFLERFDFASAAKESVEFRTATLFWRFPYLFICACKKMFEKAFLKIKLLFGVKK